MDKRLFWASGWFNFCKCLLEMLVLGVWVVTSCHFLRKPREKMFVLVFWTSVLNLGKGSCCKPGVTFRGHLAVMPVCAWIVMVGVSFCQNRL